MSYINTALKKVQKEREDRYQPFSEFILPSQKKTRHARKGLILVVLITGGIAVLGAAFIASSRLGSAMKPQHVSATAAPSATVLKQQAEEKALAARDNQARLATADEWYEKALTAQRRKRWEEAERNYQQTLSLNPRHGQALNNLGVLSMSRHRYAEATELFVRALVVQEHYVDPYYNLACLYAQMNDINASLTYLAKAVNMDGKAREWAKQDAEFKKMRSLLKFRQITEEMER